MEEKTQGQEKHDGDEAKTWMRVERRTSKLGSMSDKCRTDPDDRRK